MKYLTIIFLFYLNIAVAENLGDDLIDQKSYWEDVALKADSVIVGTITQEKYQQFFNVKYGWKAPTEQKIQLGLFTVDITDASKLRVYFLKSKGKKSWEIIDSIDYKDSYYAFQVLGKLEWGINDNGYLSYYKRDEDK
jgi:hypothetical protein